MEDADVRCILLRSFAISVTSTSADMAKGNHGVQSAYVIQNIGTGSFVTHTESSFGVEPVCMIWDDLQLAKRHVADLELEYAIAKPALAVMNRSWRVMRATPNQIRVALAVGAYGPDYQATIRETTSELRGGTTQEQVDSFRENLDLNAKDKKR